MRAAVAVETKRMLTPVTEKKLFGKTILVVEDVEMNQQLIRHILESNGAQVVIARNGAEALEQVKKQIFDCVLMDVQMPVMDGIMATEQIRSLADPILSAIPIIALTANSLPGDRERCIQAGMNDYLAKPFQRKELARLLDRYLPIVESSDIVESKIIPTK